MLDAARAATRVRGSGLSATSPVILWGFSQGGHAAAFAAEIAPTYAPDVNLKGVAMAAPVADVSNFVKRAEAWPEQFGLLVTIAYAFAKTYPELRLEDVLTPEALADVGAIENQCVQEITALYNRPIGDMLIKTPRDVPAFAKRFNESLAGQVNVDLPILVLQGNIDQIVDPTATDALVRRYCDLGVPVSYLVRTGENHNILTDDVLLPWMRGRIAGDQAPNNCSENPSSQKGASAGP
ncbi:MAG: alpha/beta hydrolase [Actinobacteria bacterium]|nr:alpha/beta hydrolase [Actinomycetota bacterium]